MFLFNSLIDTSTWMGEYTQNHLACHSQNHKMQSIGMSPPADLLEWSYHRLSCSHCLVEVQKMVVW